ncbi:MAG: penicillin-binding protein activator LpoB [Deltaproteobacteria bacterium]|nr:penicillin-binding protein activator LpoB [Deltaproteobacteria bacterium]
MKPRNFREPFLFLIIVIFICFGCAPSIKYSIADDETVTGSDWSARDLKEVSEYMADSIGKAKFTRNQRYIEDAPRWMLARDLRNDTDEHVNTRTIMEKIRTKLINSGMAKFVDDQAVSDILEQLKLQQSGLFDNAAAAKVGKLVGAKLILRGTISSIRKRTERTDIIYYNITLQIVNIETGEILWTDEKEIQRLTHKSLFR